MAPLPCRSVVFDAAGNEIDPGDIVWHAAKSGFRRMYVKRIIISREDAGDTIHTSVRIYCHPTETSGWWNPSVLRDPARLLIARKRGDE